MANKFWATTKIKFGKRVEDGSQDGKYESVVFEPGDEVTGLSKEDMKGLWDAGALTQTRPEHDEEQEEEDSSEGDDGRAKGNQSAPKPAKAAPAKATSTPSA